MDGQPRQRVIRHLGSCRVGGEHYHTCQVAFWTAADRNLTLAGIDPTTRARAEAALAAIVPRPDAASAGSPLARLADLSAHFRKPF